MGFTNVFVFLSLGSLLLLKYVLWVLESVEEAVEVGDSNIYNCIGSAFKESAYGDVASLSVVGCGYLGGLCWGISCGCRVVVNGLSVQEDCGSGSVGKDWLDGDGCGREYL
jgi:hypothetical protein